MIAEHVLGLMLALARRFDVCKRLQQNHEWATPVGPKIRDLSGSMVGIAGLGDIGRSVARLCKRVYSACELFVRNLHRTRAGLPLERIVDLVRGY